MIITENKNVGKDERRQMKDGEDVDISTTIDSDQSQSSPKAFKRSVQSMLSEQFMLMTSPFS